MKINNSNPKTLSYWLFALPKNSTSHNSLELITSELKLDLSSLTTLEFDP